MMITHKHFICLFNEQNLDKYYRPKFSFKYFCKWETFKICSNISSQNASKQLFQRTHDKLSDLILANDPRLMAKSEDYVPKLRESAAGTKVTVGVKRAELMSLHQDHNEPFRTFATNVRSKANTCNFTTVSECE